MKIITVLALVASLFSLTAYAHPGRTASDGCHYCRTNCAKWGVEHGARHCHGGLKPELQLEIMKSAGVNGSKSRVVREVTHSHGAGNEHTHSEEVYN